MIVRGRTGLTLYMPNWPCLFPYMYTCVCMHITECGCICIVLPLIEIERVPVHSVLGRTKVVIKIMANRPLVLQETYSGEGEFSEWIVHFENMATVNTLSEQVKLDWLKVRLTGREQTAYQHLPQYLHTSYEGAKEALKKRFEPASRKARYQEEFHSRKKRRTEAWADYVEYLRILCNNGCQ